MKKFIRIVLILAVWATVTWIYREKLLPVPKPDAGPLPHFRSEPPHPEAGREAPVESAPRPPAILDGDGSATSSGLADDLTEVRGIGPVYQHRLAEIGITTFESLIAGDAASIAEQIEVSDTLVREWMDQARNLLR